MTGPIDPRRATTVYRLFDPDDRLLYVGTSVDAQDRWTQHAREKVWWSTVRRATVEWHPSRTEALAAERTAIQTEKPLHNDKATLNEEAFPYRGNRGLNIETVLRRAISEQRQALDRLAIAVDRAALGGLSAAEIAEMSGLDKEEIITLAQWLVDGGGESALPDVAA